MHSREKKPHCTALHCKMNLVVRPKTKQSISLSNKKEEKDLFWAAQIEIQLRLRGPKA
jgi:hypothetical protein